MIPPVIGRVQAGLSRGTRTLRPQSFRAPVVIGRGWEGRKNVLAAVSPLLRREPERIRTERFGDSLPSF